MVPPRADDYLEELAREARAQRHHYPRLVITAAEREARRARRAREIAGADLTANLLRYSELSFLAIAERAGIGPSAVIGIQRRRQAQRPPSVRGRRGYDVLSCPVPRNLR